MSQWKHLVAYTAPKNQVDRYKVSEEFEARLSQARSDAASSVGESQLTPLDPVEEQRLRGRCWVAAAGPKHKG